MLAPDCVTPMFFLVISLAKLNEVDGRYQRQKIPEGSSRFVHGCLPISIVTIIDVSPISSSCYSHSRSRRQLHVSRIQ